MLFGAIIAFLMTCVVVGAWADLRPLPKKTALRHKADTLDTKQLLKEAEKDWKREFQLAVAEHVKCIKCQYVMEHHFSTDRYGTSTYTDYRAGRYAPLTEDCPMHAHTVESWW